MAEAIDPAAAAAIGEASMREAEDGATGSSDLAAVVLGAVREAAERGGTVALSSRRLKARNILSLREPLGSWAASSVVGLDLSGNKLRDKGAATVALVVAGSSSIRSLSLEHNGIGDAGANSLAAMLRTNPALRNLNLRRNMITDGGARSLVVALHELHTVQRLDLAKNKNVSHSMFQAACLAAETNTVREKAFAALDTLATLHESVGAIKSELGFAQTLPVEDALGQACSLLGIEPASSSGDDAAPQRQLLLTEKAQAIMDELGIQTTPTNATKSGNSVIRSLALGYAAQPSEIAQLDQIARGCGVRMAEVLGFARAQQEAEQALAKADVNPVMEDEQARRRRLKKVAKEAERDANRPLPTVVEQLEDLLAQAVAQGMITQTAASKVQENVRVGKLNATTSLVQWRQKMQDASSASRGGNEAAPSEPRVASRRGDSSRQSVWRAVVDERSGKKYYYNRQTRETSWDTPSDFHAERDFEGDGSDSDDGMPEFQEWSFESKKHTRPQVRQPPQEEDVREEAGEGTSDDEQQYQDDGVYNDDARISADDAVAAFSARDSKSLPFRECPDGRVEVSRVFHQSEELGIHPGMLLNSVAPLGSSTRRTQVGMLSFRGALDQISSAAAAAGGVSLGFVFRDQPLEALPEPVQEDFEFATLQPQVMAPFQPSKGRGPALPKRGDRYVVSFSDGAMLRGGKEMDTKPLGKLRHGQIVTVLEAHLNSEGVSIRASDGTVLMRPAPAGLTEDVTSIARPVEYGILREIDSDDDDADVLLPPPAPPRTAAQKAAAEVERALEHDAAEECAEAIACYRRAAAFLRTASKDKASVGHASYYRSKSSEYIARAEELSALVAEQRRRDAERGRLLEAAANSLQLADAMSATDAKQVTPADEKRVAKAVKQFLKDPAAADTDCVCAWLGSIGLGQCAAAFREQHIDGAVLLELTEHVMRDELGLKRMGDRAIISRELAKLRPGDGESSSTEMVTSNAGGSSLVSSAQRAGGSAGFRVANATPPPPPPEEGARVKLSARWGPGGDWIHVKLDSDEINLVAVKQRLATAMQVAPVAFSYMQYQDGQGDWFAVLQDDDLVDCVAEHNGKRLVLQILGKM